jgi:hypothetical protein
MPALGPKTAIALEKLRKCIRRFDRGAEIAEEILEAGGLDSERGELIHRRVLHEGDQLEAEQEDLISLAEDADRAWESGEEKFPSEWWEARAELSAAIARMEDAWGRLRTLTS